MKTHEAYAVANDFIKTINKLALPQWQIELIIKQLQESLDSGKTQAIVKLKEVDEVNLENRHEIFKKEMAELDARPQLCRCCAEWPSCKGTNKDCNSQE